MPEPVPAAPATAERADSGDRHESPGPVDAAPPVAGWSPYEVWRTRVFAPLQAGYNEPRESS